MRAEVVAAVLQRQMLALTVEDYIQNWSADLFSESNNQEWLLQIESNRRLDLEALRVRSYPPVRNSRTHLVFMSVGPGQFQTYTAANLLPTIIARGGNQSPLHQHWRRIRSQGNLPELALAEIGNQPTYLLSLLTNYDVAIELMAAEQSYIVEKLVSTCRNYVRSDLVSNSVAMWFFHNRGGVAHRAQLLQLPTGECRELSDATHGGYGQMGDQNSVESRRLHSMTQSWQQALGRQGTPEDPCRI